MRKKIEDYEKLLGEGTKWDLDYGKLIIIALLVYIAFFKDPLSAPFI